MSKLLYFFFKLQVIKSIREHPFNLKGEGELCFFWGKQILSANLIEKKILSLKWAEKNILLGLCALKNIVFVEKKNLLRCEAKKNILTSNFCVHTVRRFLCNILRI